MEMDGKLIICDRCGERVFLKTVGDGVADGGYTRWNKFEPKPDGWIYSRDLQKSLCPACNDKYQMLLESFITSKEIRKEN